MNLDSLAVDLQVRSSRPCAHAIQRRSDFSAIQARDVQFLAGSGRTFNVEERASIQSSLHMLKAEQVLGPLLGLAHIACSVSAPVRVAGIC